MNVGGAYPECGSSVPGERRRRRRRRRRGLVIIMNSADMRLLPAPGETGLQSDALYLVRYTPSSVAITRKKRRRRRRREK